MPNVIVIVDDDKIKSQIDSYLQEIDESNFHVRYFTSTLDFEQKYFANQRELIEEKKGKQENTSGTLQTMDAKVSSIEDPSLISKRGTRSEEGEEGEEGEEEELQILSEIDLILFKLDSIGYSASFSVQNWIDKIWLQLRLGKYLPMEYTTRFVLLKFEDDIKSKLDFLHRRLDDIIYLPFDRLIFLQKIEILLGLPKKITPSFLFTQEVNLDIEISKISRLEKLSEFGLAIRNPVRLVQGLMAHFYLTLPEESVPINIWGQVIASEIHPQSSHEFLVYFSFFGIEKSNLLKIKKHLRFVEANYQPFLDTKREHFLANYPLNLEKKHPSPSVVFLDLDESHTHLTMGALQHDIDQLQVSVENTYTAFTQRLEGNDFEGTSSVPPVSEHHLFASPVIFTINNSNLETMGLDLKTLGKKGRGDPSSEASTYFGSLIEDHFTNGKSWMQPFLSIKGNQELIQEMVSLAERGPKVSRLILAKTKEGEKVSVRMSFQKEGSGGCTQVQILRPNLEEIATSNAFQKINNIDLLILDMSLIASGSIEGFIESLLERVRGTGVLKPEAKLKIILTIDENKAIDCREFFHESVVGLLRKPLDQKQLSFLVAQTLQTELSLLSFNNVHWCSVSLPIHVAKEVHLDSLSEFGATVRVPRPIAPGTVLYLRGFVFDQAPNKCLAGRFYHCENHPKEKGQYSCSMTYFGINDAFLKYVRKLFRETYAHSKQAS
ncbi:MAG: hypothetical protein K1X29_02730 [Bdellovibrionales bacterium]|nr:hypothetical protein [Bdellovibrionales bacterium]